MNLVPIGGPGASPGQRVDSSVVAEVRRLLRAFKVRVTDAYEPPGVGGHAPGGDHPKGLALDLVPDTARGGSWDDVDRLAHLAEPSQNHPSQGFRWVGYNGDPNHGRGNHLHLSFTKPTSSHHGGIPGGSFLRGLPTVGPVFGAVDDAAGAADVNVDPIGAGADLAGKVADELFGRLVDAIGRDALRWALYVALVLAGLYLAGRGFTAATGLNAKDA